MRVPFKRPRRVNGFDITPMIDVVFNLVIFFLIASQFARNEGSEPVTLPFASQSSEADVDPRRLIVTVLPGGGMSVGGNAVDLDAVKGMIEEGSQANGDEFAVHIRADRAAPYGSVEPIMEACAALGVTRVGFKVTNR